MNRRALLIAESPKDDPVPGVYDDAIIWEQYLRSYPGGVWGEKEIIVAIDWTRRMLLDAVNAMKGADYSLLVFAGHGQTVKRDLPWEETEIFLADGTTMIERELNPATPRYSIILDVCRTRPVLTEATAMVKKAAMLESKLDPVKCRAAYDKTLADAEGGLVKVYSTGVGTSAADERSFSQAIIYGATEWLKTSSGVLTMQQAVSLAGGILARENPQQRPEYHGGRRLRHFPFAVNV